MKWTEEIIQKTLVGLAKQSSVKFKTNKDIIDNKKFREKNNLISMKSKKEESKCESFKL